MFVISYCQIYTFYPSLNLDKIVIFRSFQQSAEEMFDLSHFRREYEPFFDKITFQQLKDATTAVFVREKSTSLAELFSVEIKFTIDTLNNWFSAMIKPKFLELNDNKKQACIMENPLVPSQTICSICGFLLDVEAKGNGKNRWYNFIIECEHLFLRNTYEEHELNKMKINDIKDFYNVFERLIKLIPDFEIVLDSRLETIDFEEFLQNDLNNRYREIEELKEAINSIKIKKMKFYDVNRKKMTVTI